MRRGRRRIAGLGVDQIVEEMTYSRYQISADSWIFCIICALLLAAINLVAIALAQETAPSDAGIVAITVAFGVIGGEGALHSIWCVLAPVHWLRRLVVALSVGVLWYVAAVLGFAVTYDRFVWTWLLEPAIAGLFCLPALMLAIQSPLWGARLLLRWRIGHGGDPSMGARPARFGIRHLMAATAVVALALATAGWAMPGHRHSSRFFVFQLAIGALAAAITSFVVLLPVLVATLRAKAAMVCLVAIAGLTALILSTVILVIGMLLGWTPPSEVFAYGFVLVASFYSCLGGALLVVRRVGYRLEWGRTGGATAAESVEPVNPFDDAS